MKHFTAWPRELQEVEQEYGALALKYWTSSQPVSTLRLAVSAFSLALFGKAMRTEDALFEARSFYFKAVKRMRIDLADLSSTTIDQLLVASLLMATYDVRFAPRTLHETSV